MSSFKGPGHLCCCCFEDIRNLSVNCSYSFFLNSKRFPFYQVYTGIRRMLADLCLSRYLKKCNKANCTVRKQCLLNYSIKGLSAPQEKPFLVMKMTISHHLCLSSLQLYVHSLVTFLGLTLFCHAVD